MDYVELTCRLQPMETMWSEILTAELGEIGYESFADSEDGLKAYIQAPLFDEKALGELQIIEVPAVAVNFSHTLIKAKNWNEEWEKNFFQPIVIGSKCVVRSSFHKDVPQVQYDIVIDPKMAFGTGHHETTSLVMEQILETELEGKSVLDMGCGTGVLAILASMRGANPIRGIDIDEWAYENVLENCQINKINNIKAEQGDASSLGDETYQVIFANINRNILLRDINVYAGCMKEGSELLMSGFYTQDIPLIREEAEKNGLTFKGFNEKNNWVVTRFVKE